MAFSSGGATGLSALGALGALLGGIGSSTATQRAQQAQMFNAYNGNWQQMRDVMLRGEKLKQDEIEYDLVRDLVRKKHEFQWLRDRVNEVLWSPAR